MPRIKALAATPLNGPCRETTRSPQPRIPNEVALSLVLQSFRFFSSIRTSYIQIVASIDQTLWHRAYKETLKRPLHRSNYLNYVNHARLSTSHSSDSFHSIHNPPALSPIPLQWRSSSPGRGCFTTCQTQGFSPSSRPRRYRQKSAYAVPCHEHCEARWTCFVSRL